ncbi:MAG: hypothetical protein JW812_02000 [Alphaproteobacteria bacterium]|nr:hypothetical protein [Alphaproteobacteria bacterium]MBN2779692.1 hypothetical protein [Alphaproteobacteria bacterium]
MDIKKSLFIPGVVFSVGFLILLMGIFLDRNLQFWGALLMIGGIVVYLVKGSKITDSNKSVDVAKLKEELKKEFEHDALKKTVADLEKQVKDLKKENEDLKKIP